MSREGNRLRFVVKSTIFCIVLVGLAHLQVGGCGSDDGGGGGYFGGFRPTNSAPELVAPTTLSCAIVNDLVTLLPVSATYIDSDGTVTSLVFVTGADGVPDPNAVIGQVDAPVDGQGTVFFDPSGHDKTTVEIYAMATDNKGASSGYDKLAVYTIDSDSVGPVIPATTKPLHDWSLVDIIVSPDGNTIDFGTPSAEVLDLVTGDVAVLFSCPAFPQGGLKKVLTITDMGSSLEIVFEPATLEQAVTDADMRVLYSMTPSDADPIETIDPAVSVNCPVAAAAAGSAAAEQQPLIAPAGAADSFVVTLNEVVVYDQDGNPSTTNDQITATGSITLAPVLDLSATFRSSAMTAAYSIIALERDVQLTVSAGVTLHSTIEKVLLTIPMKDVVYMIGWIPVYIDVSVPVVLVVDGNVNPDLTSSVTVSSSTEAGVSYVDGIGWQTVSSRITTEDFIGGTVNPTADLTVHIGPELETKLYSIAGPNAGLYAKSYLDANLAADPQWSLYAGVMAQAGFETGIFSKTVSPYSAMAHDWETLVADGPRIPDLAVTGGDCANDMVWTTRPDESYDVYWSASPGVTLLSNKLADAVPGTHAELTSNTTYYYRARSRKYGSASALSGEVSATTKVFFPMTLAGAGSNGGRAIALDSVGNIYLAGWFAGTVDFDPGPGTENHTSNGESDVFITKINANGCYAWTKTFGGTDRNNVMGIAVDGDDNIFVVGRLEGTVDFDPGIGTDNHTSNGGHDGYLMKINSDGSYGWARTFGGTDSDFAMFLSLDSNNNIFVVGHFKNTVDFDPGTGTDIHTSVGGVSSDAFLMKVNADGSYGWTKTFGGTGPDAASGIALDGDDNIFVVGDFWGTVDFDPGAGTDNRTSNGMRDAFITKINADGSYGWTKTFGGGGDDGAGLAAVGVDGSGNVFLTGFFRGTVDFDPGTGTDNHTSNGGFDIFITKIKVDGSYAWTRSFGGTNDEMAVGGCALDNFGNIVVTGIFRDTVDFDPGSGTDYHTPNGDADVFVMKLNANASYGWTKVVGGTNYDSPYRVAPDSSGNIYVAGMFEDTVDFDPGPDTDNRTSIGTPDTFLMKLAP